MNWVVDQASPWLMPSRRFAKTTQLHDGAHIRRRGTGSPTPQAIRRIGRVPMRPARSPATKFAPALARPKATRKLIVTVADTSPNSSLASKGRTDRSTPTTAPSRTTTQSSTPICDPFARRPSFTLDTHHPLESPTIVRDVGGPECSHVDAGSDVRRRLRTAGVHTRRTLPALTLAQAIDLIDRVPPTAE